MKFIEIPLPGAFVVETERLADERGFFARTYCAEEFAAQGLDPAVAQVSMSYNRRRATLRGMHFQLAPHAETKLIRCTAGAIFDVIVDLRPEAPTCLQWYGIQLDAENRKSLFVPTGFAHGFQTLTDNTEVLYQIAPAYRADSAAGFRWDDTRIAIDWPLPVSEISERDLALPSVLESGAFKS
jgi:dTDP-4-dehydrorhamnose 3,5-epimerase